MLPNSRKIARLSCYNAAHFGVSVWQIGSFVLLLSYLMMLMVLAVVVGKRAGSRFVTFHFTASPVFGKRGGLPARWSVGLFSSVSMVSFFTRPFLLTRCAPHIILIVPESKCTVPVFKQPGNKNTVSCLRGCRASRDAVYTPNRSGPTLQGAELGVCSTAALHRLTEVDI